MRSPWCHMRTPSSSKTVVPRSARLLAEHRLGEELARVDRQRRSAAPACRSRRENEPSGACTPSRSSAPTSAAAPSPSSCRRRCLPRSTCATCCQPAACHSSNGPARPAEAPADGEVDVARAVRDVGEVHRDVVEEVAEDRPQELRLRVRRGAQLRELLAGILLLEDRLHLVGDGAGARRGSPACRGRGRGCPCPSSCRCRPWSSGPARPWRRAAASHSGAL